MSWKIASDTVLLSLVRHIYSHDDDDDDDDDDDYKWYNSNASVFVYMFVWIQIRNGKQGANLPIMKDEPTAEFYLVNCYGFADGNVFKPPYAHKILKPHYAVAKNCREYVRCNASAQLILDKFYHSNNSKMVCDNCNAACMPFTEPIMITTNNI
uniref:Uncharacterized protein n=1 Tax=Glossina austeni TaxID=7395 RepID=A0A1A9VHN7_GLOAU